MKKMRKWTVALATALLVGGNVAPVSAMGADVASAPASAVANVPELMEKINEAHKEITSVHSNGFLTLETELGGNPLAGQFNFDLSANIDENLSGVLKAEVLSALLGPSPIGGEIYLKDNQVTIAFQGNVTTQDVSAELAKLRETVANQMQQVAQPVDTELAEKYYDFTETDTEYIVALKENIDGKAMYEELASKIDVEKLKAEAYARLEEENVTDKEELEVAKQTIENMYNPEMFEKLFATNPKITTHYAKDSYRITKIIVDMKLNIKDFLPDPNMEGVDQLPENIRVQLDVNLDQYGATFEVMPPAATESSN